MKGHCRRRMDYSRQPASTTSQRHAGPDLFASLALTVRESIPRYLKHANCTIRIMYTRFSVMKPQINGQPGAHIPHLPGFRHLPEWRSRID
jgi:hypothetical protein